MERQENRTWECQYQEDPMISSKEHFQQGKFVVFQESLHQGDHPGRLPRGIIGNISQVSFYQHVQHVG